MKILNILTNILNPEMFSTILKKIFILLFNKKPLLSNKSNLQFINRHSISSLKFMKKISNNHKTIKESFKVTNEIVIDSDKITENYNIEFGGNYAVEVLYFIARISKPKNILETGVAAGYSSYTFLKAIKNQ